MGESCLNHLAILHYHQEITDSLDLKEIEKEFITERESHRSVLAKFWQICDCLVISLWPLPSCMVSELTDTLLNVVTYQGQSRIGALHHRGFIYYCWLRIICYTFLHLTGRL